MSPRPPFLSIIVQSHGRPDLVRRCLKAISKVNWPGHRCEVILVDDGSNPPLRRSSRGREDEPEWFDLDATLAPFELIMVRQPHEGPAAARNAGAERAHGSVLAFLDVDCTPSRSWLEKLVARMVAERGAIVGGRTVNFLAKNLFCRTDQVIARIQRDTGGGRPRDAEELAPENLGIRACDFRSLGGFDPSLRAAEGRDLSLRLRAAGHRLVFAPEVVVRRERPLGPFGFCKRHFLAGRGSCRFHRLNRERRESGTVLALRWLAAAPGWLDYPFRLGLGMQAPLMVPLLVLWEASHAAGVVWEAAFGSRRAAAPRVAAASERPVARRSA